MDANGRTYKDGENTVWENSIYRTVRDKNGKLISFGPLFIIPIIGSVEETCNIVKNALGKKFSVAIDHELNFGE